MQAALIAWITIRLWTHFLAYNPRNRLRDPALQSPRAFLWQMKTGAETLSHSRPVKTSEEVLLYASQSIRPRPRVKRSAKVSEETAGFSLGRQAPSPCR